MGNFTPTPIIKMSNFNQNIINKYYQSVDFLESLSNLPNGQRQKNPLSAVIKFKQFLKLINSPKKNLKFIHVAGTAGKGTTVNLIHNILTAAGYKVGSYFSPHPTTAIERIKVGELYISPADFAKLTDYLKPYLTNFTVTNSYGGLNFHDALLALALIYFKKEKCDYVILEAGVGGLTDISNVIPSPLIAIITNISKDHTAILGRSLWEIAKNKAGIIKKSCFFVTAEKNKKILNLFKNVCRQKKAKFMPLINVNFLRNEKLKSLIIKSGEIDNSQLAITASQILKVPGGKIMAGLKKARLPCRLEIMQKKPLVILDGSHNPTKIKTLINKLTQLTYAKLNLVFGCAQDKDSPQILKQLLPLTNQLYLTRFLMPFRKTADLKNLNQLTKKIKPNIKIQSFIDPFLALEKALKETKKDEVLLITGSFFLAGELRKKWISEEDILNARKSFKT